MNRRIKGSEYLQLHHLLCVSVLLITNAHAENAIPKENLRLTFSISDIYAPYLTPKENADVLGSLNNEVSVRVSYYRSSSKFKWTSNMSGVTGLISPGFVDTSTEKSLTYNLSPEPGKQKVSGVDIPQTLGDGYILDKLYISVSPKVFFQQSGYRKLVEKASKNDDEKYNPSFEYKVINRNDDADTQGNEHQQCFSILTPLGIPDISIPVVTNVGINSKTIRLIDYDGNRCPLVNTKYTGAPAVINGHLSPIRIASAQSDIDYSAVDRVKFSSGILPVTPSMTRFYNRSNTGVSAWVREYGPFEIFSISIRGDETNAVGNAFPVQTESWSFFNKRLVKHNSEILYINTESNNVDWIREGVYFQHDNQVGYSSQTQNCIVKDCQKVMAEVKRQLALPYEEQSKEVESYRSLTLIPESNPNRWK